jgi:3-hydroxyisobutyrate dehydrogenase
MIERIGFIGLGNIGKPIADNIAREGYEMSVYDIAGTNERAPLGTFVSSSITEVAERSSAILLCLPSLSAIEAVVAEISQADVADGTVVVNTSTVGPTVAIAAYDRLREQGISYADAPISGSVFLAGEGRLAVMFSGEAGLFQRLKPVFDTFGNNLFNLGVETGHGQRMKLLNNCLIHTAFVITSEALAFGEKGGLDMKTMLDVINVSSGQNFATHHFFPKHVLTKTYDSGAQIAISRKDIDLFVNEAKRQGCRHVVAEVVSNVITEFDEESPGVDQTMIYRFTSDGSQAQA